MTERESKIADMLMAICADKNLSISFMGDRRNGDPCAKLEKDNSMRATRISLILFEPENENDLSDWEREITNADKKLLDLKKDEEYENNHTNFFRAIRSRIYNFKK